MTCPPFLPPAACRCARTMELSIRASEPGERAANTLKIESHTPLWPSGRSGCTPWLRPVPPGQAAPRRARAQHEEDRVQNAPVGARPIRRPSAPSRRGSMSRRSAALKSNRDLPSPRQGT